MTKLGNATFETSTFATGLFCVTVAWSGFLHFIYGGIANTPKWAIDVGDTGLVIACVVGIVGIALALICAVRWVFNHVRIVIV